MIDYLQIVTEEVMEMSHVLLLQFSLLGYYSTHMINSKWSPYSFIKCVLIQLVKYFNLIAIWICIFHIISDPGYALNIH